MANHQRQLQNYFLDAFVDNSGKKKNSLDDLSENIIHHLEFLLNTQYNIQTWNENLTELNRSVINYGIQNLDKLDINSDRIRVQFCDDVAKAISTFEPRLSNITVKFSVNEDYDRLVRLRIQGILRNDLLEESILFNTSIDHHSGSIIVNNEEYSG